jgi:hypothetical protein
MRGEGQEYFQQDGVSVSIHDELRNSSIPVGQQFQRVISVVFDVSKSSNWPIKRGTAFLSPHQCFPLNS